MKQAVVDPLDYQAVIRPTEEKNEKFEMLDKIVQENYSMENLPVKTELSTAQIRAFGIGKLFAQKYKCSIVNDLITEFMTLSISKDRKSRKEFAEISKSLLGSVSMPEEKNSLRTRLLGE